MTTFRFKINKIILLKLYIILKIIFIYLFIIFAAYHIVSADIAFGYFIILLKTLIYFSVTGNKLGPRYIF